ncbi:tripartite tricarboxylate transporter TctB family protein [Nioella sp. MMSF_3534]|uniref:tripartite tricarboxylate transporter TctB family protein n=1 Tax=Nioella sp. MMSF_3534 TaxID=3046720 RepID=UPI00273D50D6|nr:tripartite tricarboxylate transporter TctB family protein [Nioella sp. MMSF_3534]
MTRLKTFQELFKRDRRPGDLVFAVLFLGFCLFLLANLRSQAQWLDNTATVAQPAFWPTVAVIGMSFFAGLHLIGSMVSPRIPGRLKEGIFWLRSAEYAVYFLIYVWSVPIVGYLLSTILFSLFLTIRLGYRSHTAIIMSVLFGLSVVLVFRTGLQVRIPPGQIYQYLPDSIRTFAMVYL